MNRSPAFQFYPDEWLGSTQITLMTSAQEGRYMRLLCHAWNSPDCGLPDDDQQLAVLSRSGQEWPTDGPVIRKCFFSRNGRLYNYRLLSERKKQKEWATKSRLGGIKSAENKRKAKLQQADTPIKGGSRVVGKWLQPNGNSPSPFPSSSLTTLKTDVTDVPPAPVDAPLTHVPAELKQVVFRVIDTVPAANLAEDVKLHGVAWVKDAILETEKCGKKSYRYAQAIMRRWVREGKPAPPPPPNSEAARFSTAEKERQHYATKQREIDKRKREQEERDKAPPEAQAKSIGECLKVLGVQSKAKP